MQPTYLRWCFFVRTWEDQMHDLRHNLMWHRVIGRSQQRVFVKCALFATMKQVLLCQVMTVDGLPKQPKRSLRHITHQAIRLFVHAGVTPRRSQSTVASDPPSPTMHNYARNWFFEPPKAFRGFTAEHVYLYLTFLLPTISCSRLTVIRRCKACLRHWTTNRCCE